jgi:2-oxoglutarate ferredoxin oxidoreductase subunit delta
MARGEITINEQLCKGCGLCAEFCARGCITLPAGSFSAKGLPLAEFTVPERCNGCGLCGWMCPDLAIEVDRYVQGNADAEFEATRRAQDHG